MTWVKKIITDGIDADTSRRLIGEKSALNIMNARVAPSDTGANLRLSSCLGSQLISQSVYPPYGTNICIGSTIDSARNRVIFFIYNTFLDHGIYAYDLLTGTTYAILYDSQVIGGLNFSKTKRIDRNARVVGDLLYWTDNNNEVRRINVEAGIKMNTASYSTSVTAYSYPMNVSVINLIRRPYGLALTAAKATDGTFAENFIVDFAGQFSSRLIYRDNEYSVMSVPSAMLNYNLSTDTFNAVDVTFPLTETFDQDVQIIQLAVRFGNKPDYFVIKEWNKANTTDAAAILAHNVGSTALTFRWYNNKAGVPVGASDSVKPEDSIPTVAKTLEVAINRLFLSNYTKGYNAPTTTSLAASNVTGSGSVATITTVKAFSSYQVGIRFRDNSGRKSSVVTNANCLVNTPDRNYSFSSYVTGIGWAVSNAAASTEIPSWAYYYDILISKNLRTRSFIQNTATNIQYAVKQQDGTFTYQSNYTSGIFGIAIDLSFLRAVSGIGYVADTGDLCRLYLNTTSTVYELAVLAQDGNKTIIKAQDLGSLNPVPGCVFEIYTPYQQSATETFYTIGQTYKVTNPTASNRTYSTTSGTITGDTTWSPFALFGTAWEYMSSNLNYWQNWLLFYGDASIQTLLGQVVKKTFIQWSNTIIAGTQTNGLSSFETLNEKAIPIELDQITKLQLTNKISNQGEGNVMLAVCPNETASLYLGEQQLQASGEDGYVAQSVEVIGTVHVLSGSSGTINPETVIQYKGLVMWYDILKGCITQYSVNGLDFVSDNQMSSFFKTYADNYLSSNSNNLDNINGFHHIPTAIDPLNEEFLFTLPGLIYSNYANTLPSYTSVPSYASSIINRFDISDSLAKTMAFSYQKNKWGSNYEWCAEWWDCIGTQVIGWKNGFPYLMNYSTNYNTVFGVQYPVRICVAFNEGLGTIKDCFGIAWEANAAPNFTVLYSPYPNIQITDLASTDYTNDEGVYYSPFLRDRLSPNSSAATADGKLYDGDIVKSPYPFVMGEFQAYSSLLYVEAINCNFDESKGQQQLVQT